MSRDAENGLTLESRNCFGFRLHPDPPRRQVGSRQRCPPNRPLRAPPAPRRQFGQRALHREAGPQGEDHALTRPHASRAGPYHGWWREHMPTHVRRYRHQEEEKGAAA